MKNIVLATSNPHKLQEINAIANHHNVFFEPVGKGFDPVENGKTFEENAYIKASDAAKLMNKAALADDTGLCVEYLGDAPGIYSARYADTQEEKISKLLNELNGIPIEKRKAYFICVMILAAPDGKILNKTVGKIEGYIDTAPHGVKGFGYDPIFFIPKLNKTMAQLSEDEKNTISHRANALLPMLKFIQTIEK